MTQPAHPEGLSMLEKRTIEAEILKEVYETLKTSHGEEVAKKTIEELVRRSAIEQARQFAASVPGGTSLKSFQDIQHLWTKGGSLEIEVREQTDKTFVFDVVRCRYAETYKKMGLGEIGGLLSRTRDGAFCEATTLSSSSNAPRRSCRARATAISNTRMRVRAFLAQASTSTTSS